MSLVPGLGIAKGMALTLRRFFEPKVTIKYPEDSAPRSRTSSAAASSSSTTSGARSSARPASSARRPARSNASTWAASTRAAAITSTGAPPRPTASDARNRRSGAPAARSRTPPTGRSPRSTCASSTRILDEYDHDPAEMLAILEATQTAYGYLPVAALKRISQRTGAWYAMIYGTATYYSHLRFEPAAASRTGSGRRPRTGRPRGPTSPRSTHRSPAHARAAASRRRRDPMVNRLKTPKGWPTILLERAGAADPTDLDAAVRAGAFDGLRRSIRNLGATATIATIAIVGAARSRRRRLPGRGEMADWRRARMPRAATSWSTATARTRRPARTATCSSTTRSRSSRARPSPPSRSVPAR